MSETPISITVIVPAYNADRTIGDALSSVGAQSVRGAGMQIVLVDDASTDGTIEAFRRAAPRDIPCRIERLSRNSGPAAARNAGLACAVTDWVAFLDSDDTWYPWRLETQIRLAAEQPDVALWCGGTDSFGGDTGSSAAHVADACARPSAVSAPFGTRDIPLAEFAQHNPVATSTVLARRGALEEAGGFDARFRGPEDYDLWMRVAARHRVVRVDRALSRYRSQPGSLSMDDRRFLPEVLGVLEKAFGAGGALSGHAHLRQTALANQYWNASWMAFNRGARGRAVRLWWLAWRENLAASQRVNRSWLRLLLRYLFMRPRQEAAP